MRHFTTARVGQIAFLAAFLACCTLDADEPWQYVAPKDGRFPSGGMRLLRLSDKAPNDLAVDVKPLGRSRFAQIRYGTADSDRVAVMIDEADNKFALYVDANRDRRIGERDRVADDGPDQQCAVSVEMVTPDGKDHFARQLAFKYRSGRLLYGTAGFVEGTLQVGQRTLAARRVDGDANGMLTDKLDRVWMDLNGDGRWDALTEQLPYMPLMRLEGRRYALSSDLIGLRLSVSEIQGAGKIRLHMKDTQIAARLARLAVVLASRDGTVVNLDRLDRPQDVPVGDYCVLSLVLTLTQPDTPKPWTFVFSCTERKGQVWYEIARDETRTIDPLGPLQFVAKLDRTSAVFSPGDSFLIYPRLRTGDGLQLQTSYWGNDSSGGEGQPHATVLVYSQRGQKPISHESCGFT